MFFKTFLLFIFLFSQNLFAQDSEWTPEQKHAASLLIETQSLIKAYEKTLHPHLDPFRKIYNIEAGKTLYSRMQRTKNGKESLLSKVLHFLREEAISSSKSLELEWIHPILESFHKDLSKKRKERVEKQSNLLALYHLEDCLHRSTPSPIQGNEDKESLGESKEKSKTDREYPDLPDTYKPHTKDTEKNKGKSSKDDQYIVAQVNFETAYFGYRYFSEILRKSSTPFKEIALHGSFRKPGSASQNVDRKLTLYTYGKTKVRLFLPSGHTPLQPRDPRAEILRSSNGAYELKLTQHVDKVEIPLVKTTSSQEVLYDNILEVYKRPIGFKNAEWPYSIQKEVFSKFDPKLNHQDQAQKLAQSIAYHIASNYLYSVGERSETDPIKALEVGAFQCDMAAYIMAALLRDAYAIPTRIVGGFRAKKHTKSKTEDSYLVMPGEAHAWVEVYTAGQWIPFDPTPIKKDKKKDGDGDGQKDEYQDRSLDNPEEPKENAEANHEEESKESQQKSSQSTKQNKSLEKQVQKDTDSRLEDLKNTVEDDSPEKDDENAITQEDLASKLEIGSLEMNPEIDNSKLKDRALRVLLKLILDPNQNHSDILSNLNKSKQIFYRRKLELQEIHSKALKIHEHAHKKLSSWLEEAFHFIQRKPLSDSYYNIFKIKQSLQIFTPLLDSEKDIILANQIISQLHHILEEMYAYSQDDSQDILLADSFYKDLPELVQTYLHERYNLLRIGFNEPTRKIAKDLRKGTLNDLFLLSNLYPHTDFISNSVPKPEYEETLAWHRDLHNKVGRDFMSFERFSDLTKTFFLNPGLSIEENIQQGTAFTITHRQRVLNPTGQGIDDAEKITIVLYDVSRSMTGIPAEFQAGLISAFTARALSERALSGDHIHRIVLLPFDDEVHTETIVTNTREALDVIHNYKTKLAQTYGGTDIQKAMLQALSLIADAQNRSGEALAAANIILMTDGQSNVDYEELNQARNAISRETPIQALFLAIGESNQELIKFSEESENMGFERAFYREFSSTVMGEYIENARTPPLHTDKSRIFTEKSHFILSQKSTSLFEKAIRNSQTLSEKMRKDLTIQNTLSDYKKLIDNMEWKKENLDEEAESEVSENLKQLRILLKNHFFKNSFFRKIVCEDIFDNIKTLTQKNFLDFKGKDQGQLQHLIEAC